MDQPKPTKITIKNGSSLVTRVLSGLLLAPLVLWAIYAGGTLFQVLIFVIAAIMMYEWVRLVANAPRRTRMIWKLFGVLYVIIPCVALLELRQFYDMWLVLWLFLVVWATDIGAYAAGRAVGGPKIAPGISPNKTWAGLAGGMLLAGVVSGVLAFYFQKALGVFIVLAMILAVIGQIGDFFESWVKRHFGVKDSGGLIPGHGGILDRVDGLVVVAPVVWGINQVVVLW